MKKTSNQIQYLTLTHLAKFYVSKTLRGRKRHEQSAKFVRRRGIRRQRRLFWTAFFISARRGVIVQILFGNIIKITILIELR